MDFFRKVRETLRDHARDDICARLQMLGIEAQMAARHRPEEKVGGYGSLGIIDIAKGPIRWVNVRKESHSSNTVSYTLNYTEYAVPDTRLGPNSPWVRINTVRVKSSPVFGKVVDLRWEGNDFGLGVISRLNSDTSIKHPIMESRDVTIHAHRVHRCWIISTETRDPPSLELWICY